MNVLTAQRGLKSIYRRLRQHGRESQADLCEHLDGRDLIILINDDRQASGDDWIAPPR
jgi:hypothetical protein